MVDKIARQGPGRFQWNQGGWFGGQIGCTAWLLPTGLILLFQKPFIGIIWLTLFAAINGFGCWMWSWRDRLLPFPAIQMLLTACGVGGLIALGALAYLAPDLPLPEITSRDGRIALVAYHGMGIPQLAISLLLLILALMGAASLTERSVRRDRANASIQNSR